MNGSNQKPVRGLIEEYQARWSEMMLQIWQDRITLYQAQRTGYLRNNLSATIGEISDDLSSTLRFDFPHYGIFVENGTGYGYNYQNGGDLPFLDETYRAYHDLNRVKKVGPAWGGYYQSGRPRKKRPWLSPSWGISRRVLGEAMTGLLGQQFFGLCSVLDK